MSLLGNLLFVLIVVLPVLLVFVGGTAWGIAVALTFRAEEDPSCWAWCVGLTAAIAIWTFILVPR